RFGRRNRLPPRPFQSLLPRKADARRHRIDVRRRPAARRTGVESERHRTRVPRDPAREPHQRVRRKDDDLHGPGEKGRLPRRQLLRPGARSARAAFCGLIRAVMYVAPLDDSQKRPRLPRTLDPVEIRILGSLAEKQLSTPEYYPLTVNALVAACNQKSNREPVMELSENEVQRALDRLQDEKLVWKVMGGRAVRYDHNLDALWHIDRPSKALLTLLFLRGPQTAGEMRGRSDRLHSFDSVADVESKLQDMASHPEPL